MRIRSGRVGADPAALESAVAGGLGAAFSLDRAIGRVRMATAVYHRTCDHLEGVHDDVVHALATALVDALLALDRWTLQVAAALRAVDRADVAGIRAALDVGLLDATALARVGADPRVALPLRSDAWRAAAAVHAAALAARAERRRRADARASAVQSPLRRVLAGIDRFLADVVLGRLDPVVELVPGAPGTRSERLAADATGLHALLAQPDLVWLGVTPAGERADARTSARVALGDPTTATHVVVLVPGTGSGVAGPFHALAGARALHTAARAAAPAGARIATVLDLHEAPPTLVEAALPGHAAAAAPRLASAVTDLLAANPHAEVTVVGHSHGGVVAGAATAAGMPVDDLVLLGAPGASVGHADDLRLRPGGAVWSALAPRDPIALVPLLGPTSVHGRLPSDPAFGARALALDGRHLTPGPTLHAPQVTGHLRYLEPGSFALANVARIAVGLQPWPPPRDGAGRPTTATRGRARSTHRSDGADTPATGHRSREQDG